MKKYLSLLLLFIACAPLTACCFGHDPDLSVYNNDIIILTIYSYLFTLLNLQIIKLDNLQKRL